MKLAGINSNPVTHPNLSQAGTSTRNSGSSSVPESNATVGDSVEIGSRSEFPTGSKRPVPADQMVSMPRAELTKILKGRQRRAKLGAVGLSSAVTAAVVGVLGTVTAGTALAIGVLPLLGTMVLDAGVRHQSLSKEGQDLKRLARDGKKLMPMPVRQADNRYKEEMVPVSSLQKENQKAIKWNGLDALTGVLAAAGLGASLTTSLSLATVAPLVLIPLTIGLAVFPKETGTLAKGVKNLLSNTVGQGARSARATRKETKEATDQFSSQLGEKLKDLKSSTPQLFDERPKSSSPAQVLYGGYFKEMELLTNDYARSESFSQRQQYQQKIERAISMAPENAKPGIPAYQSEFETLSKKVESSWLERDVSLEMKTELTKKVVNDPRVLSRIEELGFPRDSVAQQYKESLILEGSPEELRELNTASRNGSKSATRKLIRTEIFKAARVLSALEAELGKPQFHRLLDALNRPEDSSNFELVVKEVAYQRQADVTQSELLGISGAVKNLTTPM